ncbi:MAG: Zn-dependent hydrolase [Thermosynechococcaceae cyanobacterium]
MSVLTIPQANGERLNLKLAELAQIGQLANGGVSRLAFTDEDLRAREQVKSWMIEAGMTVRNDAAGNIIGRYPGQNSQAPAFATGSHIDTVPIAGRYDGCLGVLAGIEVVQTLKENDLQLMHPVEVIVFTDEECTVLGCKAMAGNTVPDPEYYRRNDGTSIQACLEQIGGNWDAIATAKRTLADIAAFVELHVEQGGLLEHAGTEIGIVKGVVGQHRLKVTILGRPNHAGTTPMDMRQDALVAAAQVVLAVNQLAVNTPGEQVATVGYLDVSPNAVNTVPAKVELKIDLRDLSQAHLDWLMEQMQGAFAEIAIATDTQIEMIEMLHVLPTLSAPIIMDTIHQVCDHLGYSYTYLPSRAGHDAQEMGRFTNMGMIFVPSQAGISHSEDEYTSPEQCAQGVDTLLQTLLKLDASLSSSIPETE